MNEWGLPISKDKIIARRNRLIEYQKLGDFIFTPLYEAIDENILDINYMLHEIENLQSKIDRANEMLQLLHYKFKDEDSIHNEIEDIQKCLKEDK